ncbi:MAG: S41 family peptidase [Candidatus Eisenbacteria bacterium]|nr:S41 family peptidase [Candidatus Eisenbacteria bacterium]
MLRRRLVIGAVLVALFGLGWWAGRVASRDLYADLDVFVEVLHRIEGNYVDPVDPQRLVQGALKGMLRDLDPYSQFLDEKEFANLQSVTHGSFGGIGIVVSVRDDYPTVISPIEGSPAWEAGLRAGDVIVAIDGKSSAGLTVGEVAGRLRGAAGTQVRVTVRREGEDGEHEVTLERRVIETHAVPYAFLAAPAVGYVRLADFSERSGAEVGDAVERLRALGAKSLVLDLRSNPGGLLEQAVDVAERFVPKGTLVVYTRGHARGQDNRYLAAEPRPNTQWPMVVLVDGGSASAAEIVAGALQDLDRALVVGRTTFGKGSVQTVFPLRGGGSALKLTTALYYTPSGRSIHHAVQGAQPDEGEDDEGDGEPPSDGRDSVPRAAFHTRAGRIVYGGGGIAPDVVVVPDTLQGLARKVESRGLAFRFANRWLNLHPEPRPADAAPVPWQDFLAWLRAEKLEFTGAEATSQRAQLERAVRRELARRMSGDSAAARVALEDDPVFARALQALARARGPRDVFAAVAPGSRGAPAREATAH